MKIAHIADIQMSESLPLGGKTVIDPSSGVNVRLLDIHRCLSHAVDVALAEKVNLAIFAGDLFEEAQPTPNEIGFLLHSVTRLADQVPVLMIPGNHDLSKAPKDASALEPFKYRNNVRISERPEVLYFEEGSFRTSPGAKWGHEGCAKIFTLPFPSKGMFAEEGKGMSIAELNALVSARLRAQVELFKMELDPVAPNILAAHLSIQGSESVSAQMTQYDPYLPVEALDEFDYVALGHIHNPHAAGKGWYSGSVDRMSFNEEGQDKGFLIVDFKGHQAAPQFRPTPARQFCTLSVQWFSQDPLPIDSLSPETVYRVEGDVDKEELEDLRRKLNQFPYPLLRKIAVRSNARAKDEQMTEDLKEGDALGRLLNLQGLNEDIIQKAIEFHHELLATL